MHPFPFVLQARELLVLEASRAPRVVACSVGELWVTCEGDPTDYVVSAGRSVALSRTGKVIVEALQAAEGSLQGAVSRSVTRPHRGELAHSAG